MQLTYVTPETREDLRGHYEALRFLHYFLPEDVECDTERFIESFAGYCTLVYSGRIVLGSFVLFPVQGNSKTAVEIHGVYRQDLHVLLGSRADAKVLMSSIYRQIFDEVFTEREKIIAKVTPGARLAKVWLQRHGFVRVPNMEKKGKTIWKLDKRTYLDGRK